MAKNILDAVHGCLIGGAIGDALGAPVEGWYWTEIREKYGKLEEFHDFDEGYAKGAGHVTDDTYLSHLMCMAIVAKGGRITPDDFAATLLEHMNPDRLWVNEHLMFIKLRQGMNPWWETGRGNIPAGCASMCIEPIGIINAGNPAQAYQDAFCIASIDQDGNNRDFAATLAAGVAAAFLPAASVDTVVEAMFNHSDYLTKRALTMAMDMAHRCADVDEFAELFYASAMMDWSWPQQGWSKDKYFCGNSIEFVSVVPAILYLCRGDVNQSIIEGANFGRDCDTIGSCCGNIAGILQGAGAIRPAWVADCEAANGDIFAELHGDAHINFAAMAEELVEALGKQVERAKSEATQLEQLLA